MAVWAISDLHLAFGSSGSRDRFGARWRDHPSIIEQHWIESVGPRDLVLIPGDISMARNHRELQADFDWLGRLPGIKILSPGNHDHWWGRLRTVRSMLRRSIRAVDADAIDVSGIIVCGARSTDVVDPITDAPDQAQAMTLALDACRRMLRSASLVRKPRMPLYVLWHHPPFDQHGRPGPWVSEFEAADVTACVYGHLHAERQWPLAVHGRVRGVHYACVAADAIGFRPLRIDESQPDPQ